MALSTYLSIITLNVSGLSALIKRQRVAEWINTAYRQWNMTQQQQQRMKSCQLQQH